MRKLVLLALLLSTPAYAADQGDVQKLAQYGQRILKYGGACPKAAVGFPLIAAIAVAALSVQY